MPRYRPITNHKDFIENHPIRKEFDTVLEERTVPLFLKRKQKQLGVFGIAYQGTNINDETYDIRLFEDYFVIIASGKIRQQRFGIRPKKSYPLNSNWKQAFQELSEWKMNSSARKKLAKHLKENFTEEHQEKYYQIYTKDDSPFYWCVVITTHHIIVDIHHEKHGLLYADSWLLHYWKSALNKANKILDYIKTGKKLPPSF